MVLYSCVVSLKLWGYQLRAAGRKLPLWQLHASTRVCGRLLMTEQRHPRLARWTRTARFVQIDADKDIYPPLTDAQVVLVTSERVVVVGLEATGVLDDIDVAQGWALLFDPQ